ncbi:MAG: transporter related protein [Actinomycetia bacterium]|nr:transporter related protein [Actinomycetes bacterium]
MRDAAWMDERRRRGPLDAAELAEAAVLGDLALVLVVAAIFLPYGTILLLAATIPYAALVSRRRFRTAVVAGAATGLLAFVIGGVSVAINLGGIAGVGTAVGIAYRRGWKRIGTVATALALVWVPGAVATVAGFLIFTQSRELTLKQAKIATQGPLNFLGRVGLASAVRSVEHSIQWGLDHWYLTVPLGELGVVIVAALVARAVALPALLRLDATFTREALQAPAAPAEWSDAPVKPVPVTLRGVGFRYPGASVDALAGVDLTVEPGTFVVIVGNNGSGKSTLSSIIAGLPPTTGEVLRDGNVGVGQIGGTARVFQRPESQVLGARVADDVRWGLPRNAITDHDIDEFLERVGLGGFALRDTETLSGGELQRLAIASALARKPALLVSDESTAMLDPDGRRTVVDVLLAAREQGTTVVHVTHEPDEAARADLVVLLDAGQVRAVGKPDDVLAVRGGGA